MNGQEIPQESMNLKQPVGSVHPSCPLEISFKFISSRELLIFNLEPPTSPPDHLPWQTEITDQLLIIYFYVSTTF